MDLLWCSAISLIQEYFTDSPLPILAEFRGPGVHHNYDDSDMDADLDSGNQGQTFGAGGYRGRAILLGDGTQVLTTEESGEEWDNADEENDIKNQVPRSSASTDSKDEASKTTTNPSESSNPTAASDAKPAGDAEIKTEGESKKD